MRYFKSYLKIIVENCCPLTVGISQSKRVIAINRDIEAPIFKIADIGIVADYHEVLAKILKI